MDLFHPTLHLSHSSSPLITHARTVFQQHMPIITALIPHTENEGQRTE